ncbi:hypothetical protein [Ruegeria sp. SCP11]|uniref:hypothetical protein n=1 Tax=Ruegeria sp. SCP11 TaxID=3141378 RepID=UPI00333C931A
MTEIDFDPDGYEECLVTFLDILGFQSLLNTRTVPEIRDMLSAFRRGAAGNAEAPSRMDEVRLYSEVHAEIVSDAIVRTRTVHTQYRDGSFIQELIDLVHVQIACIANGILVRGAMTIGQMNVGYSFDEPVFGPGLVQAYRMEEREVIFPRIAIHESLIERHRADSSLWREDHTYDHEREHLDKLLRQDEAGLHYIDYLRASLDELDNDYEDWVEFLSRHKALIEQGFLEAPGPVVRRKYNWLKNYHNRVVEEALAVMDPNVVTDEDVSWFDLISACLID